MFKWTPRKASCALVLGIAVASACSANSGEEKTVKANGGSSSGGQLNGGIGGIFGTGGQDAGAKETLVIIEGSAPANAAEYFEGEEVAAPPVFAYPESGVVLPANLNSLEFHFTPGPGQTLFELSFESSDLRLVIYLSCNPLGSGCYYEPSEAFWEQVSDNFRGVKNIQYTLRGVDGQNPTIVGVSEPREIGFSLEDIIGGLYYWDDAGFIQRYDFGLALPTAEVFMTPAQAGASVCVGCHALSPNGKKMVVGKDIPAPSPYTVFDVATQQPVQAGGNPVNGSANFFAFSPDGNQLLYSDGISIGWRDTSTGQVVNNKIVPSGTMPDWSLDGKNLVYVRPPSAPIAPTPGTAGGSLEIRTFASGSFDNPQTLVQSKGENNYYPAFSPDSEWVLFNRSMSNTDSFNNTYDGKLWVIARGGGNPIELTQASGTQSCSWPKWAPGVHTASGEPLMYYTFSSSRPYGLRQAAETKPQLWMAGFLPGRAGAGDPSTPAFRLPFQNFSSGNHIAQWVAEIVRRPCKQTDECNGDDECRDGVCLPPEIK